MTIDGDDVTVEPEGLRDNLRDDIRAFLLQRLPWNRLTSDQRDHLRQLGHDKLMRRPTYLSVDTTVDDASLRTKSGRCHYGAEGVMSHADESCVHLAFKCGDAVHSFHYSTFEVGTIVALARACEAAWPGMISCNLEPQTRKSIEGGPVLDDDDRLILDPGDDSVDLRDDDEPDEDERRGGPERASDD